jgi:hypothetical protein
VASGAECSNQHDTGHRVTQMQANMELLMIASIAAALLSVLFAEMFWILFEWVPCFQILCNLRKCLKIRKI